MLTVVGGWPASHALVAFNRRVKMSSGVFSAAIAGNGVVEVSVVAVATAVVAVLATAGGAAVAVKFSRAVTFKIGEDIVAGAVVAAISSGGVVVTSAATGLTGKVTTGLASARGLTVTAFARAGLTATLACFVFCTEDFCAHILMP